MAIQTQEQKNVKGNLRLDVILSWIGLHQTIPASEDLHDEVFRKMPYITPSSHVAVDNVFGNISFIASLSRRPDYSGVSKPANLPSLFYGSIEKLPER